jgi:hypothetical protein
MATRSAVLPALAPAAPAPPSSDRRRSGPAAWKVSHSVRKAPTLTPGQPPHTALWQPDQVTACPPEPDVIGLAVRTRHVAWARAGYGCTPGSTCSGTAPVASTSPRWKEPSRPCSFRPVRGVSPYPESWAKRAGARSTDIVPRRYTCAYCAVEINMFILCRTGKHVMLAT